MNIFQKTNWRGVFATMITAGVVTGEALLGVFLQSILSSDRLILLATILGLGGIGILLFILAVNIAASFFWKRKEKSLRFGHLLETLVAARAKEETGYRKSRRKLHANYVLLTAMLVLIWLIAGAIVIACASLYQLSSCAFLGCLVGVVQLGALLLLFPKHVKNDYLHFYALLPTEYPHLNRAMKEAATILGIHEDTNLYFGESDNVSVTREGATYYIIVGVTVVRLLSHREMVAVMLHELAHIAAGDLKLSVRNARLESYGVGFFSSVFVRGITKHLHFFAEILTMAHSKLAEKKADASIRQTDYVQDFVNASAKITMLTDLYGLNLARKNFFLEPTPPDNIFAAKWHLFFAEYELQKTEWHKRCLKSLPPRFGTHPSFGERMQSMGATDFCVDFAQKPEEAAETEKCFIAANVILYQSDPISQNNGWALNRNEHYLKAQSVVASYEEGKDIPLWQAVNGYFALCQYDKCLALAEQILTKDPAGKTALEKKALILADRFDDSCVEVFAKAMDESMFLSDSFLYAFATYLSYTGDLALKESMRDRFDKKAEETFTLEKFDSQAKPTDFIPYGEGDPVFEQWLLSVIKSAGLCGCSLCKATPLEGKVIVFIFADFNPSGEEGYNKVFLELDNREEDYSLLHVPSNPRFQPHLYKVAKKAPGVLKFLGKG